MLTVFDDVFIVALCVLASLGFLWVLRFVWPSALRREHNEIIGWQVSVLGTTYAVIMGFMLYAVWTDFTAADINANAEANSLVNVFRLAEGLPEAQRDQIQTLAREYADTMVNGEWPAMHNGQLGEGGHPILQQLWSEAIHVQPANASEQASQGEMLAQISAMSHSRRLRELQSQSKLPTILWVMLIVGGVITTLSSCLFGTDNFKLHMIQVVSLSFLLSLALVAIGDIDRPFQGTVHVKPTGFAHALDIFAEPRAR
ncbi:MAG TPA: hypothetical protein VMJ93_12495 [Verrucomicrobiae bacterium]|nr:hypothetical protein [Verrucomicrobiae bacterium]